MSVWDRMNRRQRAGEVAILACLAVGVVASLMTAVTS